MSQQIDFGGMTEDEVYEVVSEGLKLMADDMQIQCITRALTKDAAIELADEISDLYPED